MFSFRLLFIPFLLVGSSLLQAEIPKAKINQVLDKLHHSASLADQSVYFSLFDDNAIFIGTDPKETWTLEAFKKYTLPYFEKGQGWTYLPKDRHIYFSTSKQTAWFDEMLDNEKYGETRGTGVLIKTSKGWKITQYHLTIPIPNELASEVTEKIKKLNQD